MVDSVVLLMVCLLAPLTLGLYWKGANTVGAWCAMVVGAGLWYATGLAETVIDPTIYGTAGSFCAMWLGSLLGAGRKFAA